MLVERTPYVLYSGLGEKPVFIRVDVGLRHRKENRCPVNFQ